MGVECAAETFQNGGVVLGRPGLEVGVGVILGRAETKVRGSLAAGDLQSGDFGWKLHDGMKEGAHAA